MSKKDTGNIGNVITEMTGKPAVVKTGEEALNYLMPTMQRLYNLIQPYQQIVQSNNVVYFNSNEDISDNAYYIQVQDLYSQASSTFANMIDLRRNMLIGNGLIPNVEETDALYAQTVEFLNKENQYGMSMQDIWQLIGFDYALFESYYLECLFSPKNKGTVEEVIHHAPNIVRGVAHDNPNMPFVRHWMLSYSWGTTNKGGKSTKTANSGIPIDNWNPEGWAESGARQLIQCKRYSAGNNFYAVPSFNSILSYASLEAELARYSLNTVTKQFAPTTIVVLAGNPDKATKDLFVNKFKQKYTGSDAERTLFIWTTSENEKPQILPFQTQDVTPMLQALDMIAIQKIASGMGASVELIGATTGGQSLQNDMNKLKTAYDFYLFAHIIPMQKQMVATLNKIMRRNGLADVTVVTSPLKMDTGQAAPVPANNVKSIL